MITEEIKESGGAKGTWQRYVPSSGAREHADVLRATIHHGLRHLRLSRGALEHLGRPGRVALFFDSSARVPRRRVGIAAADKHTEGALMVRRAVVSFWGFAKEYGITSDDAGAYALGEEDGMLVINLDKDTSP